ncbi:MAG: hypothetical protein AAF035_07650 [Pseudomonadota bacterium]
MDVELLSNPAVRLAISVFLGMMGMPFGMVPSIVLFRELANGTDATEATKKRYAWTLWGGLAAGWIIAASLVWWLLSRVFT